MILFQVYSRNKTESENSFMAFFVMWQRSKNFGQHKE